MDTSTISMELAKMENASRIMMANNVDATQRREAESYFINLKKSNISLQLCRAILETTKDSFVQFQLSQCFALTLARNYDAYGEQDVEEACKFLLELPVKQPTVEAYAISEFFRSVATIYKRGKKCRPELILEMVTSLLQDPSDERQALGLRIIEALCAEHASLWRSNVSTSYQQHQMAKKRFEDQLLRKFMELSLACLSKFVQSGFATTHANVCERFLRVAVLVLQWNFTASMITSCLSVPLYSFNTLVALRPPPSWSELFQDEQLLPFFFELHRNVRQNSQLAQHSLSCLVQLSGVMGSVLDASRGPNKRLVQGETPPHDLYVRRFCTSLVDVFQSCHPHEILQFSTALYRIFSHHPMPIFKRFPQDLLGSYIKFIVHWASQLVGPAMNQDKEDDELGLVESLSNVYYAWSVILRSSPTFPQAIQDLVMEQNSLVIESFVKTVLAPPFGQRTSLPNDDSAEENDELEDHKVYGVIITDIGVYCRANIDPFVKFIMNSFHDRITQRQIIAGGEVSQEQRYLWCEDIHWLLLLIGSFFNDSDKDVALYLDNAYKKGEYSRTEMHPFLMQCLQNTDSFNSPANADPVTIVCGMVAHWTGILLQALETQGHGSLFVSSEICRSTIRTFATVVNFLTNLNEDQSSFFAEVASITSNIGALPSLSTTGDEPAQLIDAIICLCFAIFREFPSEKHLCDTAVCFLVQESEKRAKYIAKSALLYEKLATITLERLPSRRDFMTCLVTVGSNLTSQERTQMHEMILQPMAQRFLETAQVFQSGQHNLASHLVDLLECFSGIAKGAQIESGNILYTYLLPILHTCLQLMPISSDSRALSDSILDLYKNVATTLFIFVDLKSDPNESPANDQDNFFNLLHALFEAYKASQMKRFQTSTSLAEIEEEEQIADLITLLQTISSSITKPYMLFTSSCDNNDQCEMSLCQKTLEMILPLLNEDALRLPTLSSAFFRLLLNISEASPNVFLFIDNALSEKLLHCLCWAIGGAAGMEPTKLALETIQIVCRTLGMSTDTAQGAFVQSLFRILTAKLFEVAFNSSTELEMELQLHAIRGLYAVIRLNQQYFSEYVHSLFTRPANASNYERLIENYNQLILPGEQLADTRQAFGTFNKRFEKFVGSVESILVV